MRKNEKKANTNACQPKRLLATVPDGLCNNSQRWEGRGSSKREQKKNGLKPHNTILILSLSEWGVKEV